LKGKRDYTLGLEARATFLGEIINGDHIIQGIRKEKTEYYSGGLNFLLLREVGKTNNFIYMAEGGDLDIWHLERSLAGVDFV